MISFSLKRGGGANGAAGIVPSVEGAGFRDHRIPASLPTVDGACTTRETCKGRAYTLFSTARGLQTEAVKLSDPGPAIYRCVISLP
jgi:hypothetical protein